MFTATEGSAIAVVYALILSICYRSLSWKSFWQILVDSAKMSGMIVFLIGVSNIMGWVMAFTQIPQAISAALSHHSKLLILDEATSSVDTRTEVLIQKAMQKLLARSICNTLLISVITLAVIIVIAVLIAYLVVRRGNVLNHAIDTISMLPYIMPGSVIGIALVVAFSRKPWCSPAAC